MIGKDIKAKNTKKQRAVNKTYRSLFFREFKNKATFVALR